MSGDLGRSFFTVSSGVILYCTSAQPHIITSNPNVNSGLSWQIVLSTVTALVAIGGLVTTVWINRLERRSALSAQQQGALLRSSELLSSENPATRAVGMAAAGEYLADRRLGATAHRIAVNALHFEAEPLIVEHAVDAFRSHGLSATSLTALLTINRQLWHSLFDHLGELAFERPPELAPRASPPNIAELVDQLRRNQRIVSRLLENGSFESIDFSDVFLPDLNAGGTAFIDCQFGSAFLHYANLRKTTFRRCSFRRSFLIGAYLAHASFLECDTDDIIAVTSHFHPGAGRDADFPARVANSATEPCRSFIYELETDWRGYWRGIPDSKNLAAEWHSSSGPPVQATMTEVDSSFLRRESSDRNDGEYKVTFTYGLDRERSVQLISGIRSLPSGIPRPWRAIWWQRLGRIS